MKLTDEQIKSIKALGGLRDKTTEDCFNLRVITRNGKITADEGRIIAEAAERFGSGELAMTTRLTVEIQRVPYENIKPLCDFLAEHGLYTGGTGPKVRPVVACKGTTCVFGLIDTYSLSLKIHERFYLGYHGVKLPHKFKIAVGGCPNNCVKPDLNDLGIVGQMIPCPDYELCRGCKICLVEKCCPMNASGVSDYKIKIDTDVCNNCGRCRKKCPFGVFDSHKPAYKVYIGGRWGKKCARGIPLTKLFESTDELLSVCESAILFFKKYGVAGERLADTISRVGFDTANEIILSGELLVSRDEIIGK